MRTYTLSTGGWLRKTWTETWTEAELTIEVDPDGMLTAFEHRACQQLEPGQKFRLRTGVLVTCVGG